MFYPFCLLEIHFVLLYSMTFVIFAAQLSDLSFIKMFFLLFHDLSYKYKAL